MAEPNFEREMYGTGDQPVQQGGNRSALVSKTETPKTQTSAPKATQTTQQVITPYQMQDFDTKAWVASVLKDKYGSNPSNRDFRKLNRYLGSKEGISDIQAARTAHSNLEMQKWLDSQRQIQQAQEAKRDQETQKAIEQPTTFAGPQLVKKAPEWTATKASLKAGDTTYAVQAGNTLGQIVAEYNKLNNTNLKWEDVAKWSGIEDVNKMKIGQIINFTQNNDAGNSNRTPLTDEQRYQGLALRYGIAPKGSSPEAIKEAVSQWQADNGLPVTGMFTPEMVQEWNRINTRTYPSNAQSTDQSAQKSSSVPRYSVLTAMYGNPPVGMSQSQFTDMVANQDLIGLVGARYRGSQPYTVFSNKKGGTMNRINYFQQGGQAATQTAAQTPTEEEQYIVELTQRFMSGDQQAQQEVSQILEKAKAGDVKAQKRVAMIKQVLEAIKQQQAQQQGQAPVHKYGAKLNYVKSLKYAKGGKTCPACEKSKQIEMQACGGKSRRKKKYFGGGPFDEIEHGNVKVQTPTKYLGKESYGDKPKRVILRHDISSMPNDTLYFDNSKQLRDVLSSTSVRGGLHSEEAKDRYGTVDRWGNRNNSKAAARFEQYIR